jgi:hypothetical protein
MRAFVPNKPMRYVIQTGGRVDTGTGWDSVQGHVYADWLAIHWPT